MAIDTRDKRFSMIGFGSPVPSIFPNPDGTISVYDRAQYLWLYAGFDITTIVLTIEADVFGNLTPTANVEGV